jgi:hypothetical protein
MRTVRSLICLAILLGAVAPAAGQAPIGASDIDRLDNTVAEVERGIRTIEPSDPALASQSAKALTELRDDVVYLRVKLRRDGSVTRAEFTDVRDRLETLRTRVAGPPRVTAQPMPVGDPMTGHTLAVGTEMDVRLQTPLSSRTSRIEQRFEATTILDTAVGGHVVVPAGSVVRGFVSSVRQAGRIDRTGSLTLSFDEVVLNGKPQKLRASVVKALDPKVNDDVQRIGAGAVVGAVIGGLLGGGKGALLGVLIGGGGTIASTEGSDVDLVPGTILRIRIDQPLEVSR